MKKINNKGFGHLLVLAVLAVGISTIAYAAYSQILTVSGTGTANGSFNVAITAITPVSKTGATDATAPTFTGTSATFSANLQYPGASAVYDVTVTNSGSIPAKLTSITDLTTKNAEAPAYITFAHSGVTAGTTTLAAATATAGDNTDVNTVRVTVTWDGASSPDTTTGNTKTATITLNYSQDTP